MLNLSRNLPIFFYLPRSKAEKSQEINGMVRVTSPTPSLPSSFFFKFNNTDIHWMNEGVHK